jgi:hypothetical protein
MPRNVEQHCCCMRTVFMFRFIGINWWVTGYRNVKSRRHIDRKERLLTAFPHTDAEGRVTFVYTRVLGLFLPWIPFRVW